MTNHLVLLQRHASVARLARLMREQHVDSVPIVNSDNALVGFVTADDLLELLAVPEHEKDGLPFEFVLHRPEELRLAA